MMRKFNFSRISTEEIPINIRQRKRESFQEKINVESKHVRLGKFELINN